MIPLTAACVSIVTVSTLVIYARLEQRHAVQELTGAIKEKLHGVEKSVEEKIGTNGK